MTIMKVTDYVLLPRDQRLGHVDLNTPCIYFTANATWKSRKVLLDYLGVTHVAGQINIHCCHLCSYDKTLHRCINPLHMYIGTRQENELDKPQDQRSASASIAALSKTAEQYHTASLKAAAAQTFEERSKAATQGKANMTTEERSNAIRKGWETRRQNNSQNTH